MSLLEIGKSFDRNCQEPTDVLTLQNGDRIGNNNKCPPKADQVCTLRRDVEGTYKAYQELRERRAAAPAPTVPEYMYTRRSLKKREV